MSGFVSSGIKGLDSVIGGGFPFNTTVLLSGNPGVGKTLFSLSFLLEGARKNEKCVYVSFNEKKDELVRACEEVDSLSDVKKFLGKNFEINYLELGSKFSLNEFSGILKEYPEIDRLVLDNVNKLMFSSDSVRSYRIQFALINSILKSKANSSLLISETLGNNLDNGFGEAFDCDGVIHLSFLDLEEKPVRVLEVSKMRYSDFEPKVKHFFTVSTKGVSIEKNKLAWLNFLNCLNFVCLI